MSHTPWHHWPVALIALLWYAAGAVDYALTQFRLPAYMAFFTPDQIAYFTALPLWVDAAWALGVWGGLLGAWMLARQSAWSPLILALAFAGTAAATAWLLALSSPPMQAVTGPVGLWVMLGAVALSLAIYIYARATHAR